MHGSQLSCHRVRLASLAQGRSWTTRDRLMASPLKDARRATVRSGDGSCRTRGGLTRAAGATDAHRRHVGGAAATLRMAWHVHDVQVLTSPSIWTRTLPTRAFLMKVPLRPGQDRAECKGAVVPSAQPDGDLGRIRHPGWRKWRSRLRPERPDHAARRCDGGRWCGIRAPDDNYKCGGDPPHASHTSHKSPR